MNIGGIIHGDWKFSSEQCNSENRTAPTIVWGRLTDDATCKTNHTKHGDTAPVKFRIRLKKHVFVRCTVKEDNPFYWVARRLKKGEPVMAFGLFSIWPYTTKDGTRKIGHDFYPQAMIAGLMATDPLAYTDLHGSGADPLFSQEDTDSARDVEYNPFD